jgi:hypothetical protein
MGNASSSCIKHGTVQTITLDVVPEWDIHAGSADLLKADDSLLSLPLTYDDVKQRGVRILHAICTERNFRIFELNLANDAGGGFHV